MMQQRDKLSVFFEMEGKCFHFFNIIQMGKKWSC